MKKIKTEKGNYILKCEICGAHLTCKWCGGIHFYKSGLGLACISCGALTSNGNASVEHDYSKHKIAYTCYYCGKNFYDFEEDKYEMHLYRHDEGLI